MAVAAIISGVVVGSDGQFGINHVRFDPALTEPESAAALHGQLVGLGTVLARQLVNEPAGTMTPQNLHDCASAVARALDLQLDEIVGVDALEREGMGGISGVGRGSAVPPRLITLSYQPSESQQHLALVGKGITFDSGGLTMKNREGMSKMKFDMGGAAAALAAIAVICIEELPVQVTCSLPIAENMVSGTAIHPGDIRRFRNGSIVEIINTDAEGRLILADAIAHVSEREPDLIVDVATLTYVCPIALGDEIGGLFARQDEVAELMLAAARDGGELLHRLPLHDGYRKLLDSNIADIKNSVADGGMAGQDGGAITAALFIDHFVPKGQPWAHLDIAGPAWSGTDDGTMRRKGGTGFGVRTLVELARTVASRPASAQPRSPELRESTRRGQG